MSQATKRKGRPAAGESRAVLTITLPGEASGEDLKLGKKKVARLSKAFRKVAKAAGDAGLDVVRDMEPLTAAAAVPAAAVPTVAEGSRSGAGTGPTNRKAAPRAAGRRSTPGAGAAAGPGDGPAAKAAGRRPPVKRAAAVVPTSSSEPTSAGEPTASPDTTAPSGGVGGPTARPRRTLRRTPARPPVTS